MSKSMGYFYAILAALLNGFIGIFSVKIIQIGLPPYAVSFYKCFLALVMITCVLIATNQFSQWLLYFKTNWKKVSLCAFFGFFMLYFFEIYSAEALIFTVLELAFSNILPSISAVNSGLSVKICFTESLPCPSFVSL